MDGKATEPIQFVLDRFGSIEAIGGNRKADVDIVFDAAGAPNAIQDYVRGGKPGRRMVVIAVSANTNTVEIQQSAFVLSELRILGSLAFNATDNKEVIE